MSNQPTRPFVSQDEYERNKNTIASYREYIELLEGMNEQGRQNHIEYERVEQMLQEQIRQGDEARQKLMLLREHGARRAIDGGVAVPSMAVVAQNIPVVAPSVQPSSAYIEEVPTHTNRLNYVPQSSRTVTHGPQLVPYNQQTQYPAYGATYYATDYAHGQYNPHAQRPIVQPAPNHVQYSQGTSAPSHQAYPHNVPQAHSQPQSYSQPQSSRQSQTLPAFTPEQTEHLRLFQQQLEMAKKAKVAQPQSTLPPRYYPPSYPQSHGVPVQKRVSTPNQVPVHVDNRQGQAVPQNTLTMRDQQVQQQYPKTAAQVQAPPESASHQDQAVSSPVSGPPAPSSSSLDGALGSFQKRNDKQPESAPPPPVQTNPPVQPVTPQITSPALETPRTSTSRIDVPNTSSSSPMVNGVIQEPPVTPAARIPPASSSSAGAHDLSASPLRTPKEADKKSLARDILRALKRPRPEGSATQEPEPKRHALGVSALDPSKQPTPQPAVAHPALAAGGVSAPAASISNAVGNTASRPPIVQSTPQASSSPSITTLPPPSTSVPTKPSIPTSATLAPPISTKSPAPIAATTTTDIPSHSPLLPPQPPPSSTPAAQTSVSKVQQNVTVPAASSSRPTPAQTPIATTNANPAPQQQKNVPGTESLTSQTLAKISRISSFGRSSDQYRYHALSHAGQPSPPSPAPGPGPASAPSIGPASEPLHRSQLDTIVPVNRAPLQSLQFQPALTPDQPGPSGRPSSTKQLQPPASSSSVLPVQNVPVSAVNKGSVDSTAPNAVKTAEARNTTPSSVFPQGGQNKTPLFLPSPTSSPNLGTTPSTGIDEGAELLLSSKKDKGKRKAVDPFSSLSPSLQSVAVGMKDHSARWSGSREVFAYVLVPPLPDYAERWKRQGTPENPTEMTEQELGDLGGMSRSRSPSLGDYAGPPRSASVSSTPVEIIDLVDDEESESDMAEALDSWNLHFASYDDAEKEAFLENCAILREAFCKWLGCEVVLNSSGALIRHIDISHGPKRIDADSPWTCGWTACGYTSISREDYRQHIERHAVYPLLCPFTGCEELFRTPRQLIRHKRSDHSNDIVRRRTAEPSTIKNLSLPSIPRKLPKIYAHSYMMEYGRVRPASITQQRHEVLMPSVLRRISGNVPIQLHSYNAARPMPTTPSGKNLLDAPAPANTPYSFLQNRSTRYSSYLSTPARSRNFLESGSTYATNLVKRGLVLWPEKDGEAIQDEMIEALEDMEEEAVERELLDGDGEDVDVFGPTITIETTGSGASGGDVGRGGVSGSSGSHTDGRASARVSPAKK